MAWDDFTRARCGIDKNVTQSMARWMRDRDYLMVELPMQPYIAEVSFTDTSAAVQATIEILMPAAADDTRFSLFFAPYIKSSDGTTEITFYLEDQAGNSNSANAQAYTPGTSYATTATEAAPLELPLGSVATGGSGSGMRSIDLYGWRTSGSGTCYVATEYTDGSSVVQVLQNMWIEKV